MCTLTTTETIPETPTRVYVFISLACGIFSDNKLVRQSVPSSRPEKHPENGIHKIQEHLSNLQHGEVLDIYLKNQAIT